MRKSISGRRYYLRIVSIALVFMTSLSGIAFTSAANDISNQSDDIDVEAVNKMRREAQMRQADNARPQTSAQNNLTSFEPPEIASRRAEAELLRRSTLPVNNVTEDWMIVLVNADNPLPDSYMPNLRSLSNGLKFDERAISQLNLMLSDMKSQGLSPVVCSAYRSIEQQRTLYNNKVSQLMNSGYNRSRAETEAAKVVAYPGTSEHNLGLAVDIVSLGYQLLDNKQATTAEVRWLVENCADYGFILRYPQGKESITGIIYEPWHFRYVGVTAAQEIMDSGMCLEEYLSRQP